MLHAVTHTLTFTFILSALPPFVSLTLCLPLCSALSQPPREGSEEMGREKNKKQPSVSPLLSVSLSLISLPLPPCSSQWDVLTLCKRCACSFSIQSAKPIDPLTTHCSTSFIGERVCTCTICIHTGVHIFTCRKTLLYKVKEAKC